MVLSVHRLASFDSPPPGAFPLIPAPRRQFDVRPLILFGYPLPPRGKPPSVSGFVCLSFLTRPFVFFTFLFFRLCYFSPPGPADRGTLKRVSLVLFLRTSPPGLDLFFFCFFPCQVFCFFAPGIPRNPVIFFPLPPLRDTGWRPNRGTASSSSAARPFFPCKFWFGNPLNLLMSPSSLFCSDDKFLNSRLFLTLLPFFCALSFYERRVSSPTTVSTVFIHAALTPLLFWFFPQLSSIVCFLG